jgi:hypothetical protein
MTIHQRYKNENKIFIGLDSCANIHSVPYLPWLMHKCPEHVAIGTSGGDSSAVVSGDYAFEAKTINGENKKNKITVRISRAFGLEGSGLPLLSVSLLRKNGVKIEIERGYIELPTGQKVKIDWVNGLSGLWARPIDDQNSIIWDYDTDKIVDLPATFSSDVRQRPKYETADFPIKINENISMNGMKIEEPSHTKSSRPWILLIPLRNG